MILYDDYFLILLDGREIELFEIRFLENWFTNKMLETLRFWFYRLFELSSKFFFEFLTPYVLYVILPKVELKC